MPVEHCERGDHAAIGVRQRHAVPRGCAATYFPEANPLVALDSIAHGSGTPAYKSIEISIAASAEA